MEIEVIEGYPIYSKNKKFLGFSMHVYLPELDLDMRNVQARKTGKSYFISPPHAKNYNVEEDCYIAFPVIEFLNKNKNKEFTKNLKEKCLAYINANLIKTINK